VDKEKGTANLTVPFCFALAKTFYVYKSTRGNALQTKAASLFVETGRLIFPYYIVLLPYRTTALSR